MTPEHSWMLIKFYEVLSDCSVNTTVSILPRINFLFLVITLLHSEQPKLHRVLAILSAIGLRIILISNLLFICFNPTALSTAKTPQSFGHSECSRVKDNFDPKIILSFSLLRQSKYEGQ